MNIPNCVHCGLVALEVDGQFEKLDSYYLEVGGPPRESAGYWHTSCIRASAHGLAWHDAMLKNHVVVRRYQEIARTEEWTVVRHPRTRETLAFSRQGQCLSLAYPARPARHVAGGSIYCFEDKEHHFKAEEKNVIRMIQDSLVSTKTFSIIALFEAFGISSRLFHPESLEGSLIHFSRSLRRYWSETSVSARWEYGVFVPAELDKYVTRGS